MSVERQSPIQKIIEQNTTNGLGFRGGFTHNTPESGISLLEHLGTMNLQFSPRDSAIAKILRVIEWGREHGILDTIPSLSPRSIRRARSLVQHLSEVKMQFDTEWRRGISDAFSQGKRQGHSEGFEVGRSFDQRMLELIAVLPPLEHNFKIINKFPNSPEFTKSIS